MQTRNSYTDAMKKIRFIFLLLSLVACTKETDRSRSDTTVRIQASISGSEASTKAPVIGSAFTNNGSYGIFVCKNGTTTTAHKSNSWNIRATYTESTGSWNYYYVSNLSSGAVASTGYDHITLTARDDAATADLYAYSPYVQSAYSAGPAAIPYTIAENIGNQTDLMYAKENTTYVNAALDPMSPTDLSATFTFRHAYSLLAFRFKLGHDSSTGGYGTGTTYNLTNITVTLEDPDSDGSTTAKLYTSGTFNALTGSFNADGTEVSSLSVTYPTSGDWQCTINSASTYATAYMILVPTDVADDELVFTFTVNGQVLQPFKLQRSQLLHDDSSTYGFRPGSKYTFNFTLDNYLFFDGFTVNDVWNDAILGEMEI